MSSPEIPIADNFLLFPNKKLGSGAFGEIYKGLNTITNEEIAIKLEPIKVKHPQLINEQEYQKYFVVEHKEIIIF